MAETEDAPPSPAEELDALLEKLCRIDAELKGVSLLQQRAVRMVMSFFAGPIDKLTAQRDAVRDELAARAAVHRDALTSGTDKMIRLRHGTLRWKFTQPTLEIEDGVSEATLIERIRRARGLKKFTVLGKRTLDKKALKKSPGFVARIRGMRIIRRENFLIVLAETQAEIVKAGDPFVVRGDPSEES